MNGGQNEGAWSPLAGGLLAGAAAKAAPGRMHDGSALLGHTAREARIADNLTRLAQYEAVAADLGVTPAALALAWLLSRPGLTAPIIGPSSPDQLESALPAIDVAIDEATATRLDELFPGPGGEAPEAYSWIR